MVPHLDRHESLRTTRQLRLCAILLLVGFAVFVLGTALFHPGSEPANDHRAAFTEYGRSTTWTVVHVGQFLAMAAVTAGLLILCGALDARSGTSSLLARAGGVSAAVALGLYGALQAVDGVALKSAVDAWLAAPESEQAARFSTAEAVRWLEWGLRSYHSLLFGLTLILAGSAAVATARLPKPLGYTMVLSGFPYIAQGWILGSEGFSTSNTYAIMAGYLLVLAWTVWLAVFAVRKQAASPGAAEQPVRRPA